MSGKPEECCCDVETVDQINKEIHPVVAELVKKNFFKFFRVGVLKGLCHEDFAILGQFCPKIITYKCTAFAHTQNAPVKLQGGYQMNFIRES